MSKRTQIAKPYDPNNPRTNPNDYFMDESTEPPPKTKVFVGKVKKKRNRDDRAIMTHLLGPSDATVKLLYIA